MNLQYKWYLRRDVLGLLSNVCSATFIVFAMMVIRYEKFLHYGLGMYPDIRIPKGVVTILQAIQYFDKTSIEPLALWVLPIAIILDLIITRPFFRALMK